MGFPQERCRAPPPPIPHIILDQQAVWIGQCSHSVQSSNIGSSLEWTCNAFKLLELLWPHPPDVQACTSMYAVNSCSPYTVYGIGQGRDLLLPPLSTPWFAPNLNNPGRRPTVYHIHTQQGQQNREKANSIGRRPTV